MAQADLEQVLRKIIREENKPILERQERLEKKLDESIEENASFFIEAGTFFDEMRKAIVKRIQRIEEHLGLSHPE